MSHTNAIWAVTYGNDKPYAYVTANNWRDAISAADRLSDLDYHNAHHNGCYHLRRLTDAEVTCLTLDELEEAERNTP